MTRLVTTIALLATTCVSAQSDQFRDDPNVEQVKVVYQSFFNDFMEKDIEGIASHFSPPVMASVNEGAAAVVLQSAAEIKTMYREAIANLQEGYKYSKIDRLDVSRVTESLYYADVDYTRYNANDEVLSSGRVLYFLSNASGQWKMFFVTPATRG